MLPALLIANIDRVATVALRVLIADDDVEIRSLVRFVRRQDSTLVLDGETEDGEAAVALVREHRPDVVVMDIVMSGVDGLAATARIKRDWPATKGLVLTSLRDDDSRRAAFLNGADSFLDKHDLAAMLIPRHLGRHTTNNLVPTASPLTPSYVGYTTDIVLGHL